MTTPFRKIASATLRQLTTVLLLSIASTAFALDLDSAKSQGLVCEQADGYLRALSGSADGLVDQINRQRAAAYADIARKNGVAVDQVGVLTARKLGPKCM